MKKFITILFIAVFLAGGWAPQAGAALNAVGPTNAGNGFPQWYEDSTLLRLDQCLDTNGFCTMVPPAAGPIVFPTNFPDEWFYWSATAGPVADPGLAGAGAILVLALEAAFANGPVQVGQQATFARIRFRFTPLASGNFTVTHPYGTITVAGTAGDTLTVTQDVGVAAGIFTGALADAPPGGIVNADGRSIGPFLIPADAPFVVDAVSGNTYIANPVTPHTVTGSPLGINSFSVVGPGVNVTTSLFTLEGKVSGCLATNVAPIAVADFGAAATGQPQIINLTANDTPGSDPTTTPATVIPINQASIVITAAPLASEGAVAKNLDGTVTFTPAAGFSGNSSFTYTVQDMCALTSNAMPVPVIVEALVADKAEFRARTGKWTIKGNSSHQTVTLPPPAGDGVTAAPNVVTIHKGTPTGPVIGTAPVQADGTWQFVGKSKTPPGQLPLNIQMESAATVKIAKPLQMK